MSDTNTNVPSLVGASLPSPVPMNEYEECPVTDVLQLISDKWTMLVIVLLGQRTYRYNELRREIDGVSQRMLTRTLRELESDGLVRREVFPTVPPSVEYSLTDLGSTLLVPLTALSDWAMKHHSEISAARHGSADSQLDGLSFVSRYGGLARYVARFPSGVVLL